MPKIEYGCIKTPAHYKLFSAGGYPMPKDRDTYRWHLHNVTEDIVEHSTVLAFDRAISIWQDALNQLPPVGKYLKFESTKDIEKADFVISFGGKEHLFPYWDDESDQLAYKKCPYDFDGVSGVLAHAWTLEARHPFGGQMHMDEAEDWGMMHTHDKKDLLTVFLHEFGHNLGIAHSGEKGAIMYPTYNGRKEYLHKDDIAALKAKLGTVKKKVYEKYHLPYEDIRVDRFEMLPDWVQAVLNKMYGNRWS